MLAVFHQRLNLLSQCRHVCTELQKITVQSKKKVCSVLISRRLIVTSQNMWPKQDELRGRDTARLQSERQKEIRLYLVHQGSLSTNGARIENWSVLSYLLRVVHRFIKSRPVRSQDSILNSSELRAVVHSGSTPALLKMSSSDTYRVFGEKLDRCSVANKIHTRKYFPPDSWSV